MEDGDDIMATPAVAPAIPASASTAAPGAGRVAKKRTRSRFGELHSTFAAVAGVREYVESSAAAIRDAKVLPLIMQALSGREPAFYDELFMAAKPHVRLLLDALYSTVSTSTDGETRRLTPFAHEFVLRAEAHGAKKLEWSAGWEQPAALQLHSPVSVREILHGLSAVDVKGKCLRRIELVRGMDELQACVRHLQRDAFSTLQMSDQVAIAECLFAKARRIVLPSRIATGTDGGRKRERDEGSEATPPPPPQGAEVATTLLLDFGAAIFTSGRQASGSLPRSVKEFVDAASVFVPLSHRDLLTQLRGDMEQQQTQEVRQLEAVMALKSCDSTSALAAVLPTITAPRPNGSGLQLTLTSPDVLSALAVITAKLGDDDAKAQVCDLLVAAQQELAATGSSGLPRRALSLVVQERAAARRKLFPPPVPLS